ncbi:MAG TPA: hypothetical protein VEA99_04995 [Gemmatimonadaceae bacterium]|nr:hypothetical protein [Gemmatimonadaceae bacterium]
MPLRYDVPIASDLVFVSGFGAVSVADGTSLARDLAADRRVAPSFGMLVRVAEVEVAVVGGTDGAADAVSQLKSRGLRRTAVVAADDLGYGLGSLFASRAAAYGLAVQVFRDDLEAVSWLLGVEG